MIPKLDREMITNRKWSPMWTANDPRRKIMNGTDFGFLDFLLSFFFFSSTKGLITWWISARAEISLRPPGWNIVAITWSISAWAQNANFPWESLMRCENTIDTHARAPFSARAEKMIAITARFTRQFFWHGTCLNLAPVPKIFARHPSFLSCKWENSWHECPKTDECRDHVHR